MQEIIFVAKIHSQNGYSFYLPSKLVQWLNLDFGTWNNTVFIKPTPESEELQVDCSATRHRGTWKFSFYTWAASRKIKVKTDHLIRIPIPFYKRVE